MDGSLTLALKMEVGQEDEGTKAIKKKKRH